MKSYTTDEIRKKFLDFFASKQHPVISSDSLVPQNDPTLLFTGAGMNQFKDYFLGVKKDLKRATSSQKCLRTGDLEEVGHTAFHHSFFEMLGNFSFGNYFKKEAIEWAWEFLTKELAIPQERLRVSVHKTDDEAFGFWEKIVGKDRIDRLGDKDNFWPSNAPKDGPNGPCGPCSEIYFDQNPSGDKDRTVEHKDFAEIWNLVFTQFDRQEGGKLVPLAQKNIDTGMGLERLACVLQSKKTNYEIDIFQAINRAVAQQLKIFQTEANEKRIYAISDHARAIFFSIADGVMPGNDGRGYVIRKLIRRALYHGYEAAQSKLNQPFLYAVVPAVGEAMGQTYPELQKAQASIASVVRGEEERFLETLERGLEKLNNKTIELLKDGKERKLSGEFIFELYDTYGFPDELTRKIATEKGFEIDQKGFDRSMDEQKKRAKDASKISGSIFVTSEIEKKLAALPATKFLGYSSLESKAKIIFTEIKDGKGLVVLDQSPLYAESGGQVGDHGILKGHNFEARVVDTQKKDSLSLHMIEVLRGEAKAGEEVLVITDKKRREAAMRNHTATHLVHAALRNLLGNQVRQLGSLVASDRLRFDYSYSQALTPDQIKALEDSVNEEILKDTVVSKEEKPIEEAKKEGAIAFFGEKYGKTVRVVDVPGYSKEFCGGTHCDRTGQIGSFVITSDSSIASGTRRIEALTGDGALDYLRRLRSQMSQLAQTLKTTPDQIADRVAKLQESVKKLEKSKTESRAAQADPAKIMENSKTAGNLKFAAYSEKGMELAELRSLSDNLRSRASKTVYFLGAESGEKIYYLLGTSPDLKSQVDSRPLAQLLDKILSGKSGGRPDLVQGGAPNQGQLAEKWDKILETAVDYLKRNS